MPWGEIRAVPQLEIGGADFPFGGAPFGGMELTFTVTGWNGNATLGGLKFPNWLVVVAAGGVALISWLAATGAWRPPTALPVALAAYGLAHSLYVFVALMLAAKASVGIGVIVTAVAFVGMVVVVVRQFRDLRRTPP
jgi:FtsH-binding integral membrane protein